MERFKHFAWQVTRVVVLTVLATGTFVTVIAWTGPSVGAPSGNIGIPVNTSATSQTKAGALTIGTFTSTANVTVGSAVYTTTGDIYMPWASNQYLSTVYSGSTNTGHKFGGGWGWAAAGYCRIANYYTGGCSCPAWAPSAAMIFNQNDNTGTWYSGYVCYGS